jgi:glycosyltransferase involved in cell wall biosynthesis
MKNMPNRPPKVALVHDWLVGQRGGEHVLLELCKLFPQAPIYTLVHIPNRVHPDIERHRIVTSRIAQLPLARRHFRAYLPLFFAAVEAWDLSGFDLIISTSHCVAKGVVTGPRQTHISYIHTPARYLWDQLPQYLPQQPLLRALGPLVQRLVQPLQRWDVAAAQRPTQLLANSAYVAARIERLWQRQAEVVHPPVDVDYFAAGPRPQRRRRGLLSVSALVPYKRVDLAIALANAEGLPLTVIGQGAQESRLRALAGPTVRFVPTLSRAALRRAYTQAAGLLFCGVEDFGMAPVEAMAAGCPVLAYGCGGLTETVKVEGPQPTGVLFDSPDLACMRAALQSFLSQAQAGRFAPRHLRAHARQFGRVAFLQGIDRSLAAHGFSGASDARQQAG